jgi:hypothetical protein
VCLATGGARALYSVRKDARAHSHVCVAGGSACSFASRSSARARWPPAHTRRTNIKYQPTEQARHTWPAS